MPRLGSCSFAVVAVAAGIACSNATGTVQGGEPLLTNPCATGGSATWTYLYSCYFGPTGAASCASLASCHGAASEAGGAESGFICASKESCWMSMTQPADGEIFLPIVCLSPACSQGVTDPTQTMLWNSLHQQASPPETLDNMPCVDSPSCPPSPPNAYTFTTGDLALISAWIEQGAQDN